MRRRRIPAVAVVAVALVAALVVIELLTNGGGSEPAGRAAPALPREVLTQPRVTLASLRGHPVLVNFWASWCGACIQEMPDLQQVYASAAQQVQFLGLDLLGIDGEVRSAAVDFSKQRKVTYPLAYDDGGLLYGRISLRVLPPTTAFLRADGTLAGLHVGQMSAPELRGFIRQYLGVQVAT